MDSAANVSVRETIHLLLPELPQGPGSITSQGILDGVIHIPH